MTAEPCPACRGRCCRDTDFGGRVEHMGAEAYEHWCDYCQDGDKFVPQRTVADEREDVVAYLAHAAAYPNPTLPMNRYIEMLVELIRDGDHVGAAKGKKP